MDEGKGPSFDDPALQAAVRSAWGAESAPPGLRGRVLSALAGAEAVAAGAAVGHTGRSAGRRAADAPLPLWRRALRVAIAACFMLAGVGAVIYQYRALYAPPVPFEIPELPDTVAMAMVSAHDSSVAGAGTAAALPPATSTDLVQLTTRLEAGVGVPVLATAPGEGWTLSGAGHSTIDGARAGHVLFRRGDQSISILSAPAPASCHPVHGMVYEQVEQGHPMSGFVHGGGLYLVIGKNVSMDEVRAVRDGLLWSSELLADPSLEPGCGVAP